MTICGRCNAAVFEDETGWYCQVPVTQDEPAGLVFMDRSYTCRDPLPHDPRRTEFDVMSDARGQACPHCHAKPFWSCTWLCADPGAHEGQLHKERVALVPPAGAVPASGYERVPVPGSEDREG